MSIQQIEISDNGFGLRTLNSAVIESENQVAASLESLEALTDSFASLSAIATSLEGLQELTLSSASILADTLDISLSRAGLGVEDTYPAVIGDIGSKGNTEASEGIIKRIFNAIIEMLKKVWEGIKSLWKQTTNLYGYVLETVDSLLEEIKALKNAKPINAEIELGNAGLALSDDVRFAARGNTILPIKDFAQAVEGAMSVESFNDTMVQKLFPSITRSIFDIQGILEDIVKSDEEIDSSFVVGKVASAINEIDLSGFTTLSGTDVSYYNDQLGFGKGAKTVLTKPLPGGYALIFSYEKDETLSKNTEIRTYDEIKARLTLRLRLLNLHARPLQHKSTIPTPSLKELEAFLLKIRTIVLIGKDAKTFKSMEKIITVNTKLARLRDKANAKTRGLFLVWANAAISSSTKVLMNTIVNANQVAHTLNSYNRSFVYAGVSAAKVALRNFEKPTE